MARSADQRVLSPRTLIVWEGFEAPAHRLQACGWEFAVQRDFHYDAVEVLMRHRNSRATTTGRVDMRALVEASMLTHRDPELPVVNMGAMRLDDQTHVRRFSLPNKPLLPGSSWAAVDMTPMYGPDPQEVSVAVLGLFRPLTSEILVPSSKSIDDLLDEIRQMQQPELAEIRKRDRIKTSVTTQIVQLAA